jgi:hypothetical protein
MSQVGKSTPNYLKSQAIEAVTGIPQGQRDDPLRLQVMAEMERRRREGSAQEQARGRQAEHRRSYAGDPWKYFRDAFGWVLTQHQEDALEVIEHNSLVLLRGGNNLGKTEFLAGYGVYRFDAVAALPNPNERLDEQGCFLLLLGPDHSTIFGTSYSALLRMRRRAAQRGFFIPGEPSERSVLWQIRAEDWRIEPFSPPREGDEEARTMKSSASGRHHVNQIGLIEEAMGLTESLVASAEGMCSSVGNKIVCAFNPDIPTGPIYTREIKKAYKVVEWDAFTHPNIVQRTYIVPGAIDFHIVDAAVRVDTRDRGPADKVDVDDTYGDFIYALPPDKDPIEKGPRQDGVLGHPDGEIHVFRPTSKFSAQRRGKWPRSSDERLFDPGAFDEAVVRYEAREDLPDCPPSVVGVDPAGQGGDEPYAAPRWGLDGMTLLLRYADCNGDPIQIAALRADFRATTGHLVSLKKGDGHSLAGQLCERWPDAAYQVDEGGLGSSTLSAARNSFGLNASGVSFGAKAPYRSIGGKEFPILIPGLRYCENMRTWLYVIAAELLRVGLVDVPFDLGLREDLMAHEVIYTRGMMIEVSDPIRGKVKERKPSVILIPKDEIRKRINRSPDKADAWVLALFNAPGVVYDYRSISERAKLSLRNDVEGDFDSENTPEVGSTFGQLGKFGAGGW